MAILEEAFGTAAIGVVVAIGAAVVAPVLLPVMISVGRPMIKNAIKGAILAYGRGQEVMGEMTETLEDLTAEARTELRNGNGAGTAVTARARKAGTSARRRTGTRGAKRGRAAAATEATA